MRRGKIFIGTSGWSYKHWKGTFYPEGLPDSQHLDYYLKFFDTVELNNSFYRLPKGETFANWRKAVPPKFIFAVKASRFITHMKKLKEPQESTAEFFKNIKGLKQKAGPVLFQLPPAWKINTERLEAFLVHLPSEYRYTFEFRNHSWYTDEVYALLGKYKCAFCIYELDHHLSPVILTTDFAYIRLHGPEGKYQGSYSNRELKKWAERCIGWSKEGKDVFVYFDNDQLGYAAFNAIGLKEQVQKLK